MFNYLCRHFNALALAGLMIPAHLETFCGSRSSDEKDSSLAFPNYYYDTPFYRLWDDIAPWQGSVQPRMDIHEDTWKKTLTATLEVPGMRREDLSIEVSDDGWLTVSGELSDSKNKDDKGYTVRERRYNRFERRVRVPRTVRDKDIKASLKDGLLTVTYPKMEERKELPASTRKIRIQ